MLIAIGNSSEGALLDTAIALLGDEDPLVRGAAIWAVSQLAGPSDLKELAERHRHSETSGDVETEWRTALGS